MKRYLAYIIFLFIILINPLYAQDQQVRVTSNYVTMETGVAWSTLASRTYIFTPTQPDQSMCVFVVNNNPTNAHTFSVGAFQTGDPTVPNYSSNTGRFLADTIIGTPSPVAASATNSFYVHSNAAAKQAIQFTGGATLAGSPDTADLYIVFTNALSCGPANPSIGQGNTLSSANSGTSSTSPLQVVSDGISQSFVISTAAIINPIAGQMLLLVNAPTGTNRTLYLDHVIINSNIAALIDIKFTSNTGTTCGATSNGTNLKLGSSVTSSGTGTVGACVANPTATNTFLVSSPVSATIPSVFDMRGIILPSGSNTGIDVINDSGITGAISVTCIWYEK